MISGDFYLGSGSDVTMTIEESGYLEITSQGQFQVWGMGVIAVGAVVSGVVRVNGSCAVQVESSTFYVGPSSFWWINGKFGMYGSTKFDTGMQVSACACACSRRFSNSPRSQWLRSRLMNRAVYCIEQAVSGEPHNQREHGDAS